MELLQKYFPDLNSLQIAQFQQLGPLYHHWNEQINVISRKDIDELYLRHVLHSLGIAKVQSFIPGSQVMDVGTGGGFPGIPLAILFPETQFHLVDSIGKKIKVVDAVVEALELKNVHAIHARAEDVNDSYDFIVSRAVTRMDTFVKWVRNKIKSKHGHSLKNGVLYLKGGDLSEELQSFSTANIYPLSKFYSEAFFETKSVVHLPLKNKRK